MICDHPVPFLFLHIPKNAGLSIEQALVRAVFGVPGWENLDPKVREQHALPSGRNLQHAKLRWFEEQGLLGNHFVFTVVRNPYQRALSQIDYLRRNVGAFRAETWRDSLLELAAFDGFVENHDLGACQVDWITTADGISRCDEIIRFEDLSDGFDRVWSQIQTGPAPELPHLHDSKRIQPWWEFYDRETARAIAEKYSRDFDAFGYVRELPEWGATG
jgi:chondroitin 4-sulfotransferase 11